MLFLYIAYLRGKVYKVNRREDKIILKQLFFFLFEVEWEEESVVKIWFWEEVIKTFSGRGGLSFYMMGEGVRI